MALNEQDVKKIANELFHAFKTQKMIETPSKTYPELGIPDAYKIQTIYKALLLDSGYTHVGRKVGLTSQIMRDSIGIDEPDYSPMFEQMSYANNATIPVRKFNIPRIECEIMFKLKSDLNHKSITDQDVISATEWIAPAFEIIDNRFQIEGQRIMDSISDLAAFGAYMLGDIQVPINHIDLSTVEVTIEKNNLPVASASFSEVMEHPVHAVVWLANKMFDLGDPLCAGELILSGSATAPVPVAAGDIVVADYGRLGKVCARFS